MKRGFSRIGVGVVLFLVVLSVGVGAVAANVQVSGDISGTMVGYGDGANTDVADDPNAVVIDGTLTVSGENAENATISFDPGRHTVMDTSSAEIFVEGDQSISFESWHGPDTVQFSTAEIPAGTTLQLGFRVYFEGGTTADEISAGTISMEYESPGGTPGTERFNVTVDASNTADNRISSLEGGRTVGTVQQILSYVGGLALIVAVVVGGWLFVRDDGPEH